MIEYSSASGVYPMLLDKKPPSIRIVPPGKLRKTESIGYATQKEAAVAAGLEASRYGDKRILVFGFPGCGAKGFVEAVLRRLENRLRAFSMLLTSAFLSCEELIVEPEFEKTLKNVQKSMDDLMKQSVKDGHFVVLIIKRPDALSSKIRNFQQRKERVTHWLSSFLGKHYGKILMVCMSDDPSCVHTSLISNFKMPLYLKHLDLESTKTIFEAKLSRKDRFEIAERLYYSVEKDGFKVVSAEVVKAIDRATTLVKDFDDLSIEEAAEYIKRRIYPCYPSTDVADYENRNKELISYSEGFVSDYWPRKLKEFQDL